CARSRRGTYWYFDVW
nr:immunoglobulin heavy chain junction region [Mus musculus]